MIPLVIYVLNLLSFFNSVSGQSVLSSPILVDKANDDVSNANFCIVGHEANSCNLRSAWSLCESLNTQVFDCRIKILPELNHIYMNATQPELKLSVGMRIEINGSGVSISPMSAGQRFISSSGNAGKYTSLKMRHATIFGFANSALNLLSVAYFYFESVDFVNNFASADGGALYLFNTTGRVEHCSFRGNTAVGLGGAMTISKSHDIRIFNTTFSGVSSTYDH